MLYTEFLDSKVAIYNYYATGEGVSQGLVYDNYNDSLDNYKTMIDPIFHDSIDYLPLRDMLDNQELELLLYDLAPVLERKISSAGKYVYGHFVINSHIHMNLS